MTDLMTNKLSKAEKAAIQFELQVAREEVTTRLAHQMTFAEKGLAAMMLANGGALIALFTFIGNTVGKSDAVLEFSAKYLWAAFGCFSVGVALVLLTHLMAFFSQYEFYNQSFLEMCHHQNDLKAERITSRSEIGVHHHKRGNVYLFVGIALLILSLCLFIGGAGCALAGVLPA